MSEYEPEYNEYGPVCDGPKYDGADDWSAMIACEMLDAFEDNPKEQKLINDLCGELICVAKMYDTQNVLEYRTNLGNNILMLLARDDSNVKYIGDLIGGDNYIYPDIEDLYLKNKLDETCFDVARKHKSTSILNKFINLENDLLGISRGYATKKAK